MSIDITSTNSLWAALADEGVEYVLVGGVAMMVHGIIRATDDIDIFVNPAPGNIERLRGALKRVFANDPAIDEITAEDLGGDYPAVQYGPESEPFTLDILARLGEAFTWADVQAGSMTVTVGRLSIRVATPTMLYQMKKDTVRSQDRTDAEMLRNKFGIK